MQLLAEIEERLTIAKAIMATEPDTKFVDVAGVVADIELLVSAAMDDHEVKHTDDDMDEMDLLLDGPSDQPDYPSDFERSELR